MNYTVVIRTLGTAGKKYQRELDSLTAQTLPPEEIIVYIAEGFPLPKETCGKERYVYVKKGMVAQRALPYNEVKTEWMLMLDDDVYLPPTAVEILFRELKENKGDIISPCVFQNHKASWKSKLIRSITGKEIPRLWDKKYGFKVLDTCGFSYNNNPCDGVLESNTNAGPCLLIRKTDFLSIKFEEDLWLDGTPYSLPEDQVMYYKMSLKGLKQLTSFDSGILHLDAGTTIGASDEKMMDIIYSEYRNKFIFWNKYIYPNKTRWFDKFISRVSFQYVLCLQKLKYFLTDKKKNSAFVKGIEDGRTFIVNFLGN